ncbi:ATP-binding protein [Myxococcus sp. K15C18031901]|uniref:ATP-binding protein n=1 Tax=Myxococcus dinghuensis TaxID=2906761 RepID=UPI0020A730F8|nr:ATP-binding protein [Myxococcus dinghuensis]MCP3101807.1 ATP-binding protein [Myxococcus dinghuensis]
MSRGVSSAQLLGVLQQFMSETAARLVLRGTLESLRLSAESLSTLDLPRVLEALEPASRHFVEPLRRPELASKLKTLLQAPSSLLSATPTRESMPAVTGAELRPTTYLVRTEADASYARLAARSMCEALGGRGFECQKVATAVSELARNQVSYAGGGTIQLIPQQTPRKLLRVRAEDQGRGIPELERVLSGTYRSKTGMGLGLLGVKRLADKFEVNTGPTGTQVEFEVWL